MTRLCCNDSGQLRANRTLTCNRDYSWMMISVFGFSFREFHSFLETVNNQRTPLDCSVNYIRLTMHKEKKNRIELTHL